MTEEEKKAAAVAAEEKTKGDANEAKGLNRDGTPKQDPLKEDLDKRKGKKTHKEKLLFKKNEIERELRDLGGDETLDEYQDDDDDKPLTKREFKQMQAQNAVKTALEMTDDIENETERELVRYHINNSIKSTGNPKEDLKLAQAIVNSAKNAKIAEIVGQKPDARRTAGNGGGAPARDDEPEFSEQEQRFLNSKSLKLTKEDILRARKKAAGNVK